MNKTTRFINGAGELIDEFVGEDIRRSYRVKQEIMVKNARYTILDISHKGSHVEFTLTPKV